MMEIRHLVVDRGRMLRFIVRINNDLTDPSSVDRDTDAVFPPLHQIRLAQVARYGNINFTGRNVYGLIQMRDISPMKFLQSGKNASCFDHYFVATDEY